MLDFPTHNKIHRLMQLINDDGNVKFVSHTSDYNHSFEMLGPDSSQNLCSHQRFREARPLRDQGTRKSPSS